MKCVAACSVQQHSEVANACNKGNQYASSVYSGLNMLQCCALDSSEESILLFLSTVIRPVKDTKIDQVTSPS
jgi:hypothetical protein